jgi:Tfp pilus assembly protein PilN
VKPVNLLPEQHRPSRPSGERSGVAYKAIGGLAVVLIAVLATVLTSNEVSSKQQRAADLERETAAVTAQAGSLGPVANFLSIKQSREQSVRDLAGRRFDWERLTRELAKVLPTGLYVTDMTASVDGAGTGTGTTPAAAPTAAAAGGPQLSLSGCARDQRQVATLLVRLKQLNLAQEAKLDESKRVNAVDGSAPSQAGAGVAGVGATCTGYEFKTSVTFDPDSVVVPGTKSDSVPAALGGGK